jgi:hypothetical protein
MAEREAAVAAQLAAAEPALLEARGAVQGIKRTHLDELRSLGSPPAPVKLTLEAVLVLLGSDPAALDWAEIRRALKASDFIATVVGCETESLSPRARALVAGKGVFERSCNCLACLACAHPLTCIPNQWNLPCPAL